MPGETEDTLREEMDERLSGEECNLGSGQPIHRESWTGMQIKYVPLPPGLEN